VRLDNKQRRDGGCLLSMVVRAFSSSGANRQRQRTHLSEAGHAMRSTPSKTMPGLTKNLSLASAGRWVQQAFCVPNVTEFPKPEIVTSFAVSKFRSCRVVLRDLDGAAATREIRRRLRREVIGVSDLNWTFRQQKPITPKSILSKSRTDFGTEASSRSPHFCWP
jgi:hypothetical protein